MYKTVKLVYFVKNFHLFLLINKEIRQYSYEEKQYWNADRET